MNEETRPYHEIANIFPMMTGHEFDNLKQDIKENGLLEPIWLHQNGSILDGRNRHRACIETGTTPQFRIYEGDDPLSFVVGLNLHRRHLHDSQRAMVAAKIANMRNGMNQHSGGSANLQTLISQGQAATLMNVSERSVASAKKVHENGTQELVTAVEGGEVSVSAAAMVAELPPQEQIAITLNGHKAVIEKSKEIRAAKMKKRRNERIEKISKISQGNRPLSSGVGQFPVIYADPPWKYEHSETDSRKIENQYPTMSLTDICFLPLDDISTPDAILFLWATSPKLEEAMQVISAWGFAYRTCMVWDKEKMGMGYYARQQHELLLIATKGNIPVPKPENRPRSVYRENYNGHSVKPDYFYEMIEAMYPKLPKLEMFCRERRDGWGAWGNEL